MAGQRSSASIRREEEMQPISRSSAVGPQSGSYQSFAEVAATDNDPLVMIQVAPDSSSKYSHWHNYIQDLDFFFARMYEYHRRSGLKCIIVDKVLSLGQFVFVVLFCLFLFHLIDYDIMFKNKAVPGTEGRQANGSRTKVTIRDIVLPIESVVISNTEIFLLIFASVYWVVLFVRMVHYIVIQHAIKGFYREALSIKDVTAYTWVEVQDQLIRAQHHVLIQESTMNELDVHNRILRRTNYLIGLMNKGLIPVHYHVPLIGDLTHLSEGFLFNLSQLLFSTVGPGSLFEKNWKVRNEVKSVNNRQSMGRQFAIRCRILALLNLLLLPLIFLWQILYLFFTYAEVLKRDPSMLFGSRNWSPYSRLLCRHLNELDHQLDDRLNRGYKSATKYMNSFTSPFLEIIAKHVAFIASSVLAVLILLTVYDEDVITVEHVITIITGLGAVIAISRAFIADVIPQKHSQSELYTQILEHVHYVPSGFAPYSENARSFVSALFPYRISTLVESLVSPIATPVILAFCLPSRSQQIVDFFRVCTKEVPGTGDVCNFAMFNIRDQGNDAWKPGPVSGTAGGGSGDGLQKQQEQVRPGDGVRMRADDAAFPKGVQDLMCTEDGKLELSLIHFKLTNPKWQPAQHAQSQFIDFVTKESIREVTEDQEEAAAGPGISRGPSRGREDEPSSTSGVTEDARFKRPFSPSKSQCRQSPSMQLSSFHLQSLAAPPTHDQETEVNEILSRERSRVLSSLHSQSHSLNSSRLDSNLCMTLSTLFLHEYAGSQQQQPQQYQHQMGSATEAGSASASGDHPLAQRSRHPLSSGESADPSSHGAASSSTSLHRSGFN